MNTRFSHSGPKNKFAVKKEDKKGNDSSVVCDYCHLSGHTREKCFALHGYPDWHRLYGQPKPKVKNKFAANAISQAKTTGTTSTSECSQNQKLSSSDVQNVTDNLTESQCQQLISMLQSKMQPTTYAPWINSGVNQVSGTIFKTNSVVFASPVVVVDSAKETWILDSGATHHITPYLELVHNPIPVNSQLHLPNGDHSDVTHLGTVQLTSDITLHQVLVVPTFHCNLLSIPQLTHKTAATVVFSSTKCILQDPALMMEKEIGRLVEGLYKINTQSLKSQCFHSTIQLSANSTQMSEIHKWHWRLGHPSIKVLTHIKPLSIPSHSVLSDCDICHLAKQVRLPFPSRESSSSVVFDIIQCDMWGPYKYHTHGNCNKFLTIVDDFSKCTWIFLCSSKSQVPQLIKDFIAYVANQFQKTVKILRSDNGTEFNNHDLQHHCSKLGILQQFTCAHTPQQNGIVERKHQHLLNVSRSLRFQSNLPINFWGDCVLAATHIINMLPTPVLQYKSPFEIMFNKIPDYSHLRAFGCLCYISDLYSTPDKFAPKTLKCVFLGYPFNKKGYRVMDLNTRKCYVSRDVKFVESTFPFHQINTSSTTQSNSHMFPNTPFHEIFLHASDPPVLSEVTHHTPSPSHTTPSTTTQLSSPTTTLPERPVRARKPPVKFQDYVGLPATAINSSSHHAGLQLSGTSLKTTCTYPIQSYLSYHAFSPKYTQFICASAAIPIPYTYKQAALDAN